MKICIGIISYLPDDSKIRFNRLEKLKILISNCNKIFNLPIIIIAQNWKDINLPGVKAKFYDSPLGIVGARKELRKEFLNSEYDYIIMLDDDCEIFVNDDLDGKLYLDQIKEHPGMCGIFAGTLLKLFAISKELFKLVNFGDGSVESGDFFEDILFVNTILTKYKDKVFTFKKNGLAERSNNFDDPNSTWFYGQYNKHDIGDRTRKLLKEI